MLPKLQEGPRRPNMAAMIRLVKVVQSFKACLKKRRATRRQGARSKKLDSLIAPDEAYAALETSTSRSRVRDYRFGSDRKSSFARDEDWEAQYWRDRDELDRTTSFSAGSCTDCAADYGLFREATPLCPKKFIDATHCATELERAEALLDRLQHWGQMARNPACPVGSASGSISEDWLDELLFANLEHLLRRYIGMLLTAFVRALLFLHSSMVEHLRRIARVFGEGWFFEWPNCRRPLSSTWPWNVKPSLVILWGVCWMFYGPANTDTSASRINYQNQRLPQLNTPQTPYPIPSPASSASSTGPPMLSHLGPYGSGGAGPGASSYSLGVGREGVVSQSDIRTSGPGATSASTDIGGLDIPRYLPDYMSGSDPFGGEVDAPSATLSGPLQPNNPSFTNPYDYSSVDNIFGIYLPEQPRATLRVPNVTGPVAPQESTRFGLGETWPPSREMSGAPSSYPSPGMSSNGDGHARRSATGSAFAKSPTGEDLITGRRRISRDEGPGHREREGPRDSQNRLYCDEPSCADKPPTFGRNCEWSKHMDKHQRPYRCEDPMCANLPGFTYSGGLQRHRREVHQKDNEGRKLQMCPYSNCSRSTGKGFTRRENLNEHIRRLHKGADDGAGAHDASEPTSTRPEVRSRTVGRGVERKRKRDEGTVEQTSAATPSDIPREVAELRAEVKRLKKSQEELLNASRAEMYNVARDLVQNSRDEMFNMARELFRTRSAQPGR